MMLNRCEFIGNLGRDPEIRRTGTGDAIANFTVAVTERWTQDGEKKERTEWIRAVAFKQVAGIAEKYLRKGQLVYLAGRLQTRSWDDKDGQKRYATEIIADTIRMLGKAPEGQTDDRRASDPEAGGSNPPGRAELDDALPF